jgi:hypothetical protein
LNDGLELRCDVEMLLVEMCNSGSEDNAFTFRMVDVPKSQWWLIYFSVLNSLLLRLAKMRSAVFISFSSF